MYKNINVFSVAQSNLHLLPGGFFTTAPPEKPNRLVRAPWMPEGGAILQVKISQTRIPTHVREVQCINSNYLAAVRRTWRFFKMVLKYLKWVDIDMTRSKHISFILTINRKKFLKSRTTPRQVSFLQHHRWHTNKDVARIQALRQEWPGNL